MRIFQKKRKKPLLRSAAVGISLVAMLGSSVFLAGESWAWFTDRQVHTLGAMGSATFRPDVSVLREDGEAIPVISHADGSYSATLQSGYAYRILLAPGQGNTASGGYFLISAGETKAYTGNILADGSYSFTMDLTNPEDTQPPEETESPDSEDFAPEDDDTDSAGPEDTGGTVPEADDTDSSEPEDTDTGDADSEDSNTGTSEPENTEDDQDGTEDTSGEAGEDSTVMRISLPEDLPREYDETKEESDSIPKPQEVSAFSITVTFTPIWGSHTANSEIAGWLYIKNGTILNRYWEIIEEGP